MAPYVTGLEIPRRILVPPPPPPGTLLRSVGFILKTRPCGAVCASICIEKSLLTLMGSLEWAIRSHWEPLHSCSWRWKQSQVPKPFCFHGATAHSGPGPTYCRGLTIALKTPHSVGRLWTSDQSDADTTYLTTRNTGKRQTSMPPASSNPQSQQVRGRRQTR
jgi:hypothetical protein